MNGTGVHNPSLHTLDVNKMQMVGFQYSWYGAGFIDFMIRGPDGHWTMVHRMKNNNINNEAFMRSGNLPVRYSIENDSPTTSLTATINASTTTIGALELGEFDDAGTIMIDNEIIFLYRQICNNRTWKLYRVYKIRNTNTISARYNE